VQYCKSARGGQPTHRVLINYRCCGHHQQQQQQVEEYSWVPQDRLRDGHPRRDEGAGYETIALTAHQDALRRHAPSAALYLQQAQDERAFLRDCLARERHGAAASPLERWAIALALWRARGGGGGGSSSGDAGEEQRIPGYMPPAASDAADDWLHAGAGYAVYPAAMASAAGTDSGDGGDGSGSGVAVADVVAAARSAAAAETAAAGGAPCNSDAGVRKGEPMCLLARDSDAAALRSGGGILVVLPPPSRA
jgi:hypothetical protein